MSFYPDFISILSWFYPDFIQMLSSYNWDKVSWFKMTLGAFSGNKKYQTIKNIHFYLKIKVFWWNEAVEVIEATEVVEAIEAI